MQESRVSSDKERLDRRIERENTRYTSFRWNLFARSKNIEPMTIRAFRESVQCTSETWFRWFPPVFHDKSVFLSSTYRTASLLLRESRGRPGLFKIRRVSYRLIGRRVSTMYFQHRSLRVIYVGSPTDELQSRNKRCATRRDWSL